MAAYHRVSYEVTCGMTT